MFNLYHIIKNNIYIYVVIFATVCLLNLITVGIMYNLLVSVPQILVVLYFILRGKTDVALVLHTLFVLTCIAATSASGIDLFEGVTERVFYSYSTLKLYGPFGISYILIIIIAFMSVKTKRGNSFLLFMELFKNMLFLLITGLLIGLLGFVIDDNYSFKSLIKYSVYIFIVVVTILAFIKNDSKHLRKTVKIVIYPSIVAACIAAVIGYYCFGIETAFGTKLGGIILYPDICFFGPILLIGLLTQKYSPLMLIGLLCYLLVLISAGGGKFIMAFIGAVIICMYFAVSSGNIIKKSYRFPLLLGGLLLVLFVLTSSFLDINEYDTTSKSSMKFTQILSILYSQGDVGKIANSPYVRVGELIDILENGLRNPFFLIFGHGFGGYYTDNLHFFSMLSYESNWSYEDFVSGKFTTAHDMYSSVPLVNGLLGLYLIIRLSFLYIKKLKYSIFAFGVIPWLLLQFYFNIQTAIAGILLLYAVEPAENVGKK